MAGIAGQYHQIGPIRLEGKCWPIRIWDVNPLGLVHLIRLKNDLGWEIR